MAELSELADSVDGYPRLRCMRNVIVGRRIVRSANIAASMAKALRPPNSRSEGKSESTSAASAQANTIEVRMSAGPTSTVAR